MAFRSQRQIYARAAELAARPRRPRAPGRLKSFISAIAFFILTGYLKAATLTWLNEPSPFSFQTIPFTGSHTCAESSNLRGVR
jgi:hypothetical protein